jgi:hypothetical protein
MCPGLGMRFKQVPCPGVHSGVMTGAGAIGRVPRWLGCVHMWSVPHLRPTHGCDPSYMGRVGACYLEGCASRLDCRVPSCRTRSFTAARRTLEWPAGCPPDAEAALQTELVFGLAADGVQAWVLRATRLAGLRGRAAPTDTNGGAAGDGRGRRGYGDCLHGPNGGPPLSGLGSVHVDSSVTGKAVAACSRTRAQGGPEQRCQNDRGAAGTTPNVQVKPCTPWRQHSVPCAYGRGATALSGPGGRGKARGGLTNRCLARFAARSAALLITLRCPLDPDRHATWPAGATARRSFILRVSHSRHAAPGPRRQPQQHARHLCTDAGATLA